jgi:hypothetical protein
VDVDDSLSFLLGWHFQQISVYAFCCCCCLEAGLELKIFLLQPISRLPGLQTSAIMPGFQMSFSTHL